MASPAASRPAHFHASVARSVVEEADQLATLVGGERRQRTIVLVEVGRPRQPLVMPTNCTAVCRPADAQPRSTQTSRWSELASGCRRDEAGQLVVPRRPEHAGVDDVEPVRGQDVVGAQVAEGVVVEVGGVERRVTRLRPVRQSLGDGRFDRPLARRCGVLDLVEGEHLIDRAGDRVTVGWVAAQVAGDDERGGGREAAGPAGVVDDPGGVGAGDVVGPEPDLVGVAHAVAVLRPVAGRRRRARRQHVDELAGHVDRYVPVRRRRERQHRQLVGRVPVGGIGRGRVVGQAGARHRGPEQVLERAHLVGRDREPRQQDHPVLAGEVAVAEGVVRSADGAVVVEVEARRHAGVRRGDEDVRVVDRLGAVLREQEVVGAELVDRRRAVDVDVGEQQHVGTRALDDRGDVGRLLIVRASPGRRPARRPCCGSVRRRRWPPARR